MAIFSIGLYSCIFFSFPYSFMANHFAIANVFALLHDMWTKHPWICLIINITYISIRYLEIFTFFSVLLICQERIPYSFKLLNLYFVQFLYNNL